MTRAQTSSSRQSAAALLGNDVRKTKSSAAATIAKSIGDMQARQKGTVQEMRAQMGHITRQVLRNYFAHMKPDPNTNRVSLEKQSVVVIKRVNKILKKCKRRLKAMRSDVVEQVDNSTSTRGSM